MKNKNVNVLDYNKVRSFCDWEIVYHLSGSITSLSPGFAPRKLQIIISKFMNAFQNRPEVERHIVIYSCVCSYNEFTGIIKDILMNIPEYVELNLTSIEYKEKIDPNYIVPKDERFRDRKDFIDLDACIQSITNGLYRKKEIFGD